MIVLVMRGDSGSRRPDRQRHLEGRQAFRGPKMAIVVDDLQKSIIELLVRHRIVERAVGNAVKQREVGG